MFLHEHPNLNWISGKQNFAVTSQTGFVGAEGQHRGSQRLLEQNTNFCSE
jgi:hypothetical protein